MCCLCHDHCKTLHHVIPIPISTPNVSELFISLMLVVGAVASFPRFFFNLLVGQLPFYLVDMSLIALVIKYKTLLPFFMFTLEDARFILKILLTCTRITTSLISLLVSEAITNSTFYVSLLNFCVYYVFTTFNCPHNPVYIAMFDCIK